MENIDEMLRRAIDCIKCAVDSNEMIGKPITASDGNIILPVSRLSYGFVVGAGEYGDKKDKADNYPYTGAAGGGVTVTPVGFVVCGRDKRYINAERPTDGKWTELLRAVVNTLKRD